MLDLVAQKVRGYEGYGGTKQSCSYVNIHFFKKLYFNPGKKKAYFYTKLIKKPFETQWWNSPSFKLHLEFWPIQYDQPVTL